LRHPDPRGSRGLVSASGVGQKPLPAKLKRALELVYSVEGVVSARLWHWPGRIAVGVRGGSSTSPMDLLHRVEIAVAGLRDADEAWDFGILEDETSRSPAVADTSATEGGVSSQRK
jgi:hypothetical protein